MVGVGVKGVQVCVLREQAGLREQRVAELAMQARRCRPASTTPLPPPHHHHHH